ncbi:MFS transporter [candidate division KSB1 bacterium]|nr:MFS transporter [candidate division KSB1 bacterium]
MKRTELPKNHLEPIQWRRVFLLSSAHFVNDSYHGFVAPLLPVLMTTLGLSLTYVGVLTSIQALTSSLSQFAFGHFADRIKSPWMVVTGPVVTATFLGLIGILKKYELIVIVLIFAGLGTAAFHPQGAMFAAKASGRQRGLGMSIFVTGGSAGHAMGALIILPIVTFWGMQYSVVTISFGILISILLFINLPSLPQSPISSHKSENPVLPIVSKKPLILLAFIVTIRAFMIVGFITFIPVFLHSRNVSLLLSGSAITVFELSGAAGALLGGPISDRIGRKPVILYSLLLPIPLLYLFTISFGIIAFLILGLAGLLLHSSIPVAIVLGQDLYPQRVNTITSVLMGVAWGLGGLLVSPLGMFADRYGLQSALQILTLFGLTAVFASLFLSETKKND